MENLAEKKNGSNINRSSGLENHDLSQFISSLRLPLSCFFF